MHKSKIIKKMGERELEKEFKNKNKQITDK